MTNSDKKYMRTALKEALKGSGMVSPNPLVGAVVVKNGKIIGKGYHKKFGEKHAEVNAFENCSESPAGADLYVTLEPCSHHGKTPPCTDRITAEKIKRVFIGNIDTSPHSSGRGIKILEEAGIEVVTGVCENECRLINGPFFYSLENKLPYIAVKAASSVDGCMSTETNDSKWITNEKSRKEVHRLRNYYDAVMVGKNTVLSDDPQLSVRYVKGRNPIRIIVDESLSLRTDHKVFDGSARVIIITSKDADTSKETYYKNRGISLVKAERSGRYVDLRSAFAEIFKTGIRSVMVEGGGEIHSYILNHRLAQRAHIFIAPVLIGSGRHYFSDSGFGMIKDSIELDVISERIFDKDIYIDAFLRYRT
ncbi:MAG: bifunctional diaminohydroxyphosphoribosylaminopyrimidine deaminase/5-amino-6-(5-phosphoribosylamino)uracil reductase RibD [Candidatus Delongbacteria bacterium]|nr:bifunctional diaminohydroxyphosphoribosylaminopyrimidine deaminase/5-amino-6-(5-phosphoribosylamino)uracil reductase RibD [Candidatus Delongbacteria bacterium]